MLTAAMRSTTKVMPPATSGRRMWRRSVVGPRVRRIGPRATVASASRESGNREPARAARTAAVAAAAAASSVAPGASRTNGVR